MRFRKQMALALFFLLAMTGSSIASRPAVTISTANRFAIASVGRAVNIALTVRVEKSEGNRNLFVGCNSFEGISVASGRSLGGAKERSIFDVAFNLTPAMYKCEAVLIRIVDGKEKEFRDSMEIIVIF